MNEIFDFIGYAINHQTIVSSHSFQLEFPKYESSHISFFDVKRFIKSNSQIWLIEEPTNLALCSKIDYTTVYRYFQMKKFYVLYCLIIG